MFADKTIIFGSQTQVQTHYNSGLIIFALPTNLLLLLLPTIIILLYILFIFPKYASLLFFTFYWEIKNIGVNDLLAFVLKARPDYTYSRTYIQLDSI